VPEKDSGRRREVTESFAMSNLTQKANSATYTTRAPLSKAPPKNLCLIRSHPTVPTTPETTVDCRNIAVQRTLLNDQSLGVRGLARASIMRSALYAIASPSVTWVIKKRSRCSFHHRVAL